MLNNIGEARRFYESTLPSGKFTQEDAARYFGVSIGTYAHWEQCKGKLNGEILCAIADKYGCSTDYLLCRTSDPSPYPPSRRSFADPQQDALNGYYESMNSAGRATLVESARLMSGSADVRVEKNIAEDVSVPTAVEA